jgi:alcohol dehydrogenase (NADP+)
MRFIELNNQVKMPILGLGTWKSEAAEVYSAIRWGLKLGYTHFDCAAIYHNEEAVGQALTDAMREDGIKREDLFVTSKLWNNSHKKEDVFEAFNETLKRLRLDYLDLYLIHWPVAQKKASLMPLSNDDMVALEDVPLDETWRALEELYDQGKVRAIGVSNFGIKRLEALMGKADINPMVNQVERHPYLPQTELLEFCRNNMIALTAYAPLGSGHADLLNDSVINKVAVKNKITAAEVLLAWNMAHGVAVIPKAIEEKHLKENIQSLNVTLDEEDMHDLDSIEKRERFLKGDVFAIGPYAGTDIFA